jgi:hypothetical protein
MLPNTPPFHYEPCDPCDPCHGQIPIAQPTPCPPTSGGLTTAELKAIVCSTGIDTEGDEISGLTWAQWIGVACDLFPLGIQELGKVGILYAASHLIQLSIAQASWNYAIVGAAAKGSPINWASFVTPSDSEAFWGLTPHGMVARSILQSHLLRRKRAAIFAV